MEEIKSNVKPRRKHPLDNADIISWLLFFWLLPFFKEGYKKELTEDDIFEHRKSHDSGQLGDKLEATWNKLSANNKKPSLIKAIIETFFLEALLLNFLIFTEEMIRISQPFFITKLILVYENNRANEDKSEIYIYAALIVITSYISNNMAHNFNLAIMQLAIKIRVSCCSLIYRKALRLSKSALAETTVGQMVNLLSNDVGRFDQAIFFFHYTYLAPIEMLIVMYLLYVNVDITALAGAMLLLLSIPFQFWLGKKTSQFRLSTATRTDERVRLMNEIISGIQVIKMYTWEFPFAKLVEFVRRTEIKYIRYTSVIRAILISCSLLLNRCAVGICILTYVLTGNPLTATYAYAVTAYYRLLYTITNYFPIAVSQSAEMYISTMRIQKFLTYDEVNTDQKYIFEKLKTDNRMLKSNSELRLKGPDARIFIKEANAKWLKSSPENNLENINMDLTASSVTAVIGPVGSGKTTLLHIIMKELKLESGVVTVQGVVSYASQEPWLFGGSIRQNILFGQKFDQKKYNEVVKVCALKKDFTLLPYGDRTLAGERGVTLSGGQRARINLARAVYKEADIYLLDDPLSAVDTHVGKQLFDDCISGYLGNKCVVLVTHQLQYLKKLDSIYLMNAGKVEASGSYSFIKSSTSPYSKLLANIADEEEEVRRRSRLISMNEEMQQQEEHEMQELQKEERGTGKIAGRVYLKFARAGGSNLEVACLVLGFLLSQILDSSSEYFVTFWVNIQQWHLHTLDLLKEVAANNATLEINSTITNTSSLFTSTSLPQALPRSPFEDWWLTPIFTTNTALYYAILILIIVGVVLSTSLAFYRWCLNASTTLHNRMFVNIVYSPMIFFNNNPSGRILNRFSKDVGTLDEVLPMTLIDTIQIALMVAASTIVIGSLTLWILIPTVLMSIAFYFIRIVYVATSRDVKRIESVTRSPVFTHLSASLQGLTTIRAFKAQKILKKEFDHYQNLNSSAYFLYVAASRTFGFWLDFFCISYIALVIAALIFVKSEQFGGNMGLALTQAMALTGILQWGMRQWSEFENQMTSVERVQEYADLVQEKDQPSQVPEDAWPEKGRIEFRDVSLRYSPEDDYVLKNLKFVINPSEKIGIVGRTGAGKSSLIQALFRLADIDGSIVIDGFDTKTIALKFLRSKISIIPQEPVLFSGTLRKNLDPFDEYNDETLWSALEEVELKHVLDELPAGLDSKMAEGGSNFSVGQRQLLCLARAIIRNNKILVLDEATANVDPQTDNLIQTTIRNRFANCTVLTIAHRLHTIMDSDKVLVMDAGKNVEFDHPHTLLQNQKGVFSSLVRQTGKATAKHLRSIAEENQRINNSNNSN